MSATDKQSDVATKRVDESGEVEKGDIKDTSPQKRPVSEINSTDEVKQKIQKTDHKEKDKENGEAEEKYEAEGDDADNDDDDEEVVPEGEDFEEEGEDGAEEDEDEEGDDDEA